MAQATTDRSMSDRLTAVAKSLLTVCALVTMAEGFDIVHPGVYTMPPTPTSNRSGHTPEQADGTTAGFTTDPPSYLAHLNSPNQFNAPSGITALQIRSPGMSPACAASRKVAMRPLGSQVEKSKF